MSQKPFRTKPEKLASFETGSPTHAPGQEAYHYVQTPPEMLIAQQGPIAKSTDPDVPEPTELQKAKRRPYGYAVVGEASPEDAREDGAGTAKPMKAPNAFVDAAKSYSPMKLKK